MLLIDPFKRRVAIAVRADNVWIYPSMDSLNGGFLEAKFTRNQDTLEMHRARREAANALAWAETNETEEYHDGETLEQCAVRECFEENGIRIDESQLVLFGNRSNPRTDTRAHVINACYWAELTAEQIDAIVPGDDIKALDWMSFDLINLAVWNMAFNHDEILKEGFKHYQRELACRAAGL
jgi:ADP-ribose pyrophosphatase YjhB (NUDIX family)